MWNAFIECYAQHDHGEECKLEGFSLDAITFACSLKACCIVGAKEKGEEIHAEIKMTKLSETNIIFGNMLIDMRAKYGLLAKEQEVFDMLCFPNVLS